MLDEQVLFVNNEQVTSFDQQIQLQDTIKIVLPDGKPREEKVQKVTFQPPKIILFHKPKGYVVSKEDPHNKTIYELLPKSRIKDFWYIGRLDKDSTGLLLLTNDSRLVDEYENPRNNVYKVYHITIDKPLRTKDKIKASKGVEVTEKGYLPDDDPGMPTELLKCVTISYSKTTKEQHELIITLNEGKKRHIRRLLKALGYKVYKLHRLKVGKRHIGNLKPGKYRLEKIKRGTKK
jgi:23S rRNA pseudouridine2605 synthase